MPASKGRWWLTHDSHQIVISTSPERIYDLVADLPRMGEWSPECERVEWADGSDRRGRGRQVRRSQPGRAVPPDALVPARPRPGSRPRPGVRLRHRGGRPRVHRVAVPLRARRGRHPGHRVLPGAVDPGLGPDPRRPRPTATESCTRPWATPSSSSKRPPKPRPARQASHDDAGEPAFRPAPDDRHPRCSARTQPRRRSPMSTDHVPAPSPIALQPGEGEALWFMGFLATIKATAERTGGRVAVIHHLGPQDAGSPLHVHHRENEWFYVLDGELTIWVGGQVIRAPAGSFVFGPQGTPHTFTGQLTRRRQLLAGHRAGRVRGLHADLRRAGPVPDPAAATGQPPRPGTDRRPQPRRRIRHRDHRPARHPVIRPDGPSRPRQSGGTARHRRPSSAACLAAGVRGGQ